MLFKTAWGTARLLAGRYISGIYPLHSLQLFSSAVQSAVKLSGHGAAVWFCLWQPQQPLRRMLQQLHCVSNYALRTCKQVSYVCACMCVCLFDVPCASSDLGRGPVWMALPYCRVLAIAARAVVPRICLQHMCFFARLLVHRDPMCSWMLHEMRAACL